MQYWLYKFMGLLLVSVLLESVSLTDYEDEDEKPPSSRCVWIRNKLKNGRVKIRSRGRIAKFVCNSGYQMVGKRFATCVRGQWNNPIPHCVARGCYKMSEPANGKVTEMNNGAVVVYDCFPGYSLEGPSALYCDGARWSDAAPICGLPNDHPELTCDFEDPDLCGWTNDPSHDFEWRRNQFRTPSGHVGTGPDYDHTFGEHKAGFYLYLEASSPRLENDACRIFSPVFPPHYSAGCFTFWYHMYGSTIGRLRVYIKPENQVFGELTPTWEQADEQGKEWLQGVISIGNITQNFQLIIEGVRGSSYVGDIAIDDVALWQSSCETVEMLTTSAPQASGLSCRGRCKETEASEICGCSDTCAIEENCCEDYTKICTSSGDPSFIDSETPPSYVVTDYLNAASGHFTTIAPSNISTYATDQNWETVPLETTIGNDDNMGVNHSDAVTTFQSTFVPDFVTQNATSIATTTLSSSNTEKDELYTTPFTMNTISSAKIKTLLTKITIPVETNTQIPNKKSIVASTTPSILYRSSTSSIAPKAIVTTITPAKPTSTKSIFVIKSSTSKVVPTTFTATNMSTVKSTESKSNTDYKSRSTTQVFTTPRSTTLTVLTSPKAEFASPSGKPENKLETSGQNEVTVIMSTTAVSTPNATISYTTIYPPSERDTNLQSTYPKTELTTQFKSHDDYETVNEPTESKYLFSISTAVGTSTTSTISLGTSATNYHFSTTSKKEDGRQSARFPPTRLYASSQKTTEIRGSARFPPTWPTKRINSVTSLSPATSVISSSNSITKTTLIQPSETTTILPKPTTKKEDTISLQPKITVTEVKPDPTARTLNVVESDFNTDKKPEEYAKQHSRSSVQSEDSQSSNALTATILSLTVIGVIVCAVGYYYVTRRKRFCRKGHDDSEIRFLSENEILEFTDTSSVKMLLNQ